MKRRCVIAVLLVLTASFYVTVSMLPNGASGAFLYVGGGGPGNYTLIRYAIENATSGDTIFVYNGTYVENVLVDKSVSLVGESRGTTVIDGGGGVALRISSDWVNVSGFSMVNASTESSVNVSGSSHCRVFANAMQNSSVGISASSSSFIIISDNIIRNNSEKGVNMFQTDNVTVSGNFIDSNALVGIGITAIARSSIVNNTISNGSVGIEMNGGTVITLTGNAVRDNSIGVEFSGASSNVIFHNEFVNNTSQASDDSATDSWDDGYPMGGNYWSDYVEPDVSHGPNQNLPGADGMGDTPRPISDGTREDRYPLMKPFPPSPRAPPTAPRNLQATAGDGQVTLDWTPPAWDGLSAVTNYAIYRGLASGGENYLTTVGNVTTHLDNGLTNGVKYYYEVSAINAAGEGSRSNEANATPARIPLRPRQLNAVGGDTQVTLTWLPPANDGGAPVANYTIYRGTISGGETFLVKLGNVLTYLDAAVTNGVTYYYLVSATNVMGEGPNSTQASATPMAPPSAPLNLQAAPGNAQVVLTWSAPTSDGGSPVTNYEIYRGTTSGGETFLVQVANVLTHTDTGLTNGQRYFYKVSARNAVGEGPQSNEANATPDVIPSAPRTLTGVPGDGRVTLTWLPPLTGNPLTITYNLYRGPSPGSETLLATGVSSPHLDTGLTNGALYCYQVTAVNGMGEGPRSNEACATPVTVPSAPRNLVATGSDRTVTLTWSAPSSDGGSPITNYGIYRGTLPGGETLLQEIGNLLTFVDSGLTNGQSYFYKVSAKNAVGEGPQSAEAVGIPAAKPSSPQNLQATRGNGQVTLDWEAPLYDGGYPIINYTVYRGTFPGGESLLVTIGVTLSYLDTGLTNGVTYYYKMSATNLDGEGPMSNEASATPATTPQPPTIVSAIGGDGEVILTISPPADSGGLPIMTYKMFRGTTPGGEVFILGIGTPSKHYDAGLMNGVTYYYQLTAVNQLGESGLSGEESATPMAPPSQPLSLSAVAGDGQVQLSWLAPTDDGGSAVTAYKVYRGTVSGGETLLITLGNVLLHVDSAVTNGITYFYKVSAVNSAGEGAKSSETSARPHVSPTVPGAPLNLQAAGGVSAVTLAWQPPASDGGEPISQYTVYRGTTPTALSQIGAVSGSLTSFNDAGVASGTTHYYQVSATNMIGEGSRSNTASATIPGLPGQPTGLSAMAGILQATLSWSAPASDGGSQITNYRIYRGTSPGLPSPSLVATTGNVLTYTDMGLSASQVYYYSVSAVNAVGEGQRSAEQSVAIAQPPNDPPTCSISSPAQGATVSGTYVVQGLASDQDGRVVVVEIRLDGGEWKGAIGVSAWSYSWNTRMFSNGQHTIEARAFDGRDFSQLASVTVSVDNPTEAGQAGPQGNAAGTAAVVVLLILAVLLGFLVFRRRSREEPQAPEPRGHSAEDREEAGGSGEASAGEVAPEKRLPEDDFLDEDILDDEEAL